MSKVKIVIVGARFKEGDEHDIALERRLNERTGQTGELVRKTPPYRVLFEDGAVEEFEPQEVIHLDR